MLERARRMIGDDLAIRGTLRDEIRARQILTNIHGKRRYTGSRRSVSGVMAQHVAIILNGGAAARGHHQDSVERRRDRAPGRDVAASSRMRLPGAAHVVDEAAATSL